MSHDFFGSANRIRARGRCGHPVASVDLQPAVLAGVNEADIGWDYLELPLLDIGLVC